MVSDGGTFKVPVTINGQLTLNFTVDSGASDVSVPADVFMTLVRTGTITDADFLDKQTYKMADGSTVPSQRFVIRSLKVGDKTLENVVGSIAPVAGGLLLGQSFLRRFDTWSIDNHIQALILRSSGNTATVSTATPQPDTGPSSPTAAMPSRFPYALTGKLLPDTVTWVNAHGSALRTERALVRRRRRDVQSDHTPLAGGISQWGILRLTGAPDRRR
jgi:gag-polyprotein putative aspartyl protease